MQYISDIIKIPLIKAAFATNDRSEQKKRIMFLWEQDLITKDCAVKLIYEKGLRHD